MRTVAGKRHDQEVARREAAGLDVGYVELGSLPRVDVWLYPENDALITVEGVECPVPRGAVSRPGR
nr:hypothetical protein [Streptomyces bicolor]